MILNQLLNNRLSNKALLRLIVIFTLIGFADTAYLTADHYFGTGVKCVLLEGCDVVLLSQYSKIFEIPLAAIGFAFYVGVFILINLFDIYRNNLLLKLLVLAGASGFIVSLILLYVQIFIIGALCVYCLVSVASSTAIFITAIFLNKNSNHLNSETQLEN